MRAKCDWSPKNPGCRDFDDCSSPLESVKYLLAPPCPALGHTGNPVGTTGFIRVCGPLWRLTESIRRVRETHLAPKDWCVSHTLRFKPTRDRSKGYRDIPRLPLNLASRRQAG